MFPSDKMASEGLPFASADAVTFFREMDEMRKVWQAFQPEGLSKSSLSLLAVLHKLEQSGHKQISMSKLARMVHHSAPATSQKISALVENGLVVRKSNPDDRRVCYVCLTEEGRTMVEQSFQAMMQRVDFALAMLGPTQTKELLRLMQLLIEALGHEARPAQSEQTEENQS